MIPNREFFKKLNVIFFRGGCKFQASKEYFRKTGKSFVVNDCDDCRFSEECPRRSYYKDSYTRGLVRNIHLNELQDEIVSNF